MKYSHSKLSLVLLLLPVFLIGCLEGETGPAGPVGPPGDDATSSPYSYQGDKGAACMHCHSGTVATVLGTNHTGAWDDLDAASQANLYCAQCHTTGFDAVVNYGDTEVTTPGPDMYGYDDYVGVAGDEAAERRAALEGVQCESCHGPMGPDFNAHKPILKFSTYFTDPEDATTSTSMCVKCHSGGDFSQLDEWAQSGHARTGLPEGAVLFSPEHLEAFRDEWGRTSCNPCHTAEGFIWANDPAYANRDQPEDQSLIGCVACHDPHAGENSPDRGNQHQLRNLGDYTILFWQAFHDDEAESPIITFANYETSQICVQCHHARRDAANVEGQIANGSGHMGPHRSNQMDMFLGAGSWEIEGYEYDRGTVHNDMGAHNYMESPCVQCHMESTQSPHGEPELHSSHTFAPAAVNCLECHSTMPEDFNYDGPTAPYVGGIHDHITGLLDDLASRFPLGPGLVGNFADAAEFFGEVEGVTAFASNLKWDHDGDANTPTVLFYTDWQRECAYAMYFVEDDGSHGVHNSAYSSSLLENAAAYYDTH